MERYKVRFSKNADNDLRATAKYIATQLSGPITAAKWAKGTKKAIREKLTFSPQKYRLAAQNADLAAIGLRRVNIKMHAAFFIIHEKEKIVIVRQIIYARRDLDSILSGDAGA